MEKTSRFALCLFALFLVSLAGGLNVKAAPRAYKNPKIDWKKHDDSSHDHHEYHGGCAGDTFDAAMPADGGQKD